MNQLKDGKKHISQKREKQAMSYNQGSRLDVPEELQKELREQGLVWRWVNAPNLIRDQGFNKNHWKPYKIDYDKLGLSEFFRRSDGFLTRGDTILAVRPVGMNEAHKEQLAQMANSLKGTVSNRGQDEINQMMKAAGIKNRVSEDSDN